MPRYDITFSGHVQGVNFRATTVRVAGRYRVRGWVRNEPDGTVRCLAEGDADEVDRFVQAVRERMAGYIRDTHVRETDASEALDGFSIRY